MFQFVLNVTNLTLNNYLSVVFVFSKLIGGNTCEESAVSSVAFVYFDGQLKAVGPLICEHFISWLKIWVELHPIFSDDNSYGNLSKSRTDYQYLLSLTIGLSTEFGFEMSRN